MAWVDERERTRRPSRGGSVTRACVPLKNCGVETRQREVTLGETCALDHFPRCARGSKLKRVLRVLTRSSTSLAPIHEHPID